MSSARVKKLEALLRRVEERRNQPRLQAVSARESSPTVPDLERVAPAALRSSLPAPSEPVELPTMPPAAIEPPRKVPSISPLETAMAQLDDSGALELPAPSPAISLAEPQGPVSLPQEMVLTHRPGAEPLEPEVPVELIQPKRAPVEREPTIEFETAKVRVNARELRAVGEPAGAPPSPPAPLTAPSQTLEAAPLPPAAQPARVVSAARVQAPKTFGELLDQSLALRPRA